MAPTTRSKSSSKPQRAIPRSNIPSFTIDLSLPPRERYKSLATAYLLRIRQIVPLFNALLSDLGIPESHHGSINTFARLLMRGVHSRVETAELRGISEVTGVEMYLLVALNVVLDLLMGCTSGAVRAANEGGGDGEEGEERRMLHFRTLDWGMDPLRDIIVKLDFVRSGSRKGNGSEMDGEQKVIASSITYVGFVGVLTGVRKGLSMSLNFRAMHNAETRWQHFRFYFHHLLVLSGMRPSISSLLRNILFDEKEGEVSENPRQLDDISQELGRKHTTAAYLVFCDGQKAIAMDKDYDSATTRQRDDFIVATNHDVEEKSSDADDKTPTVGVQTQAMAVVETMKELLDDSKERMECVEEKWERRWRRATKAKMDGRETEGDPLAVSDDEVVKWATAWPTTNETTHFAAVMDAQKGEVVWGRLFEQPVREPR